MFCHSQADKSELVTSVLKQKLLKQNLRLIFFTFICAEVQVLVSVCITQEVFVCVCVCVCVCDH